jgi:hypothetical protein
MKRDGTIMDRDAEIQRLKDTIDNINKDGNNKDDRFKAMEERYKSIIKEKDNIIYQLEEKLRDMGNQVNLFWITLVVMCFSYSRSR